MKSLMPLGLGAKVAMDLLSGPRRGLAGRFSRARYGACEFADLGNDVLLEGILLLEREILAVVRGIVQKDDVLVVVKNVLVDVVVRGRTALPEDVNPSVGIACDRVAGSARRSPNRVLRGALDGDSG